MQTQRQVWKGFQQYTVESFVVSSCIVAVLVLHFADVTPSAMVKTVHTPRSMLSQCVHPVPVPIPTESVQSRTLSMLAEHAQHLPTKLDAALAESKQHRQSDANLNLSYTSQHCISGNVSQSGQNAGNAPVSPRIPVGFVMPGSQAMPATHLVPQKPLLFGSRNAFPSGQCTWWANQRYYQLHGYFVPWSTNANAFQWVARALGYGWRVSGIPVIGSIIVLQPFVDGAYAYGHVGVVERVLTNGRVIASSLNWGSYPGAVTQSTFVIRPGVSFISSF